MTSRILRRLHDFIEGKKDKTRPDKLDTSQAPCTEAVQLKAGCMSYLTHLGIVPDPKGRAPWEELAKVGDAISQMIVGSFHLTGYGIPEDVNRAAEYFREAANHGQNMAMVNLAVMHFKGFAVPQDQKEAYFWASLATHFHLPDASGLPAIKGVQAWIGKGLAPEAVAEVHQRVQAWRPKDPVVGSLWPSGPLH